MSIWCEGSSERVYTSGNLARCPVCNKVVELTHQGHIKPHVESKIDKVEAKKPTRK